MIKLRDLAGQRFGELTALKPTEERRGRRVVWLCQCSCGKQAAVTSDSLVSGNTTSCGHLRGGRKDLVSRRFGRLVALEAVDGANEHIPWLCRCDCGREVIVLSSDLIRGHTQSCGCYNRGRVTTHGLSKTRAYRNAKNRERKEKKRGLDIEWTHEMEAALCAYFPTCVVDGSTQRMSTDHVLPLSGGNGLRLGNAVRLCNHCNCVKNNRSLDQLPSDMRDKIIQAASDFQENWLAREVS